MPLVADTTALRYLIEIEAVHLLPAMFAHVIIPPEVAAELQRPKTPAQVRAWMASPPPWLIILQLVYLRRKTPRIQGARALWLRGLLFGYPVAAQAVAAVPLGVHSRRGCGKIGRASCRERV